jgi:hypothetical protein
MTTPGLIDKMFQQWYVNYNVPAENQDHFRNKVVVELNDTISNPAGTYEVDGVRHLIIRPEWCNAGVLAHEQAHNSYALLTEAQKTTFETAYDTAQSDPYIVLLHKVNTYMNSLDAQGRHVEGHAELYRYIGLDKLPEALKQYYPKLI